MKAMIFAAGLGSRLRPITEKTPKTLVKVKGRPILDWIINHLSSFGADEFLINTHHLHYEIKSYLNQNPYPHPIAISNEPEILGTGGGLYNTKEFWGDDVFFAYNGDVICNADLNEFLLQHRQKNALVSLAVCKRKAGSRLLVDENGALVGIERNRKRTLHRKTSSSVDAYHFCGIHLISPAIFPLISPPAEFSLIDLYLKLLNADVHITVWDIGDAYWESIEDAEMLEKANREFPGLAK